MLAIIKKEFKSYLYSPVGYIFVGLTLLLASTFFQLNVLSQGNSAFANMFTIWFIVIVTFLISMLTMRLFAEEKKTGTDQLLYTSPISLIKITLAKFLSAMTVLAITTIFLLMYLVILLVVGTPNVLNAMIVLLGFFLLSSCFVSFGMFASALTEHQIIAAILSAFFFIFNLSLKWLGAVLFSGIENFHIINMFGKFTVGQLSIESITMFVSFTVLFIVLTILVLQRKRTAK